jgi:hypothetical protein
MVCGLPTLIAFSVLHRQMSTHAKRYRELLRDDDSSDDEHGMLPACTECLCVRMVGLIMIRCAWRSVWSAVSKRLKSCVPASHRYRQRIVVESDTDSECGTVMPSAYHDYIRRTVGFDTVYGLPVSEQSSADDHKEWEPDSEDDSSSDADDEDEDDSREPGCHAFIDDEASECDSDESESDASQSE